MRAEKSSVGRITENASVRHAYSCSFPILLVIICVESFFLNFVKCRLMSYRCGAHKKNKPILMLAFKVKASKLVLLLFKRRPDFACFWP